MCNGKRQQGSKQERLFRRRRSEKAVKGGRSGQPPAAECVPEPADESSPVQERNPSAADRREKPNTIYTENGHLEPCSEPSRGRRMRKDGGKRRKGREKGRKKEEGGERKEAGREGGEKARLLNPVSSLFHVLIKACGVLPAWKCLQGLITMFCRKWPMC